MTCKTPRGPLGDARPTATDTNIQTPGSTKQQPVEDRDNVSRVTPEDYPHQDRLDGDTSVNQGAPPKEGGRAGVRGSAKSASDKGANFGADPAKGGSH